jgi:hypothetical protein
MKRIALAVSAVAALGTGVLWANPAAPQSRGGVTADTPVEQLRELKILPDPNLTPGETNSDVTQDNIGDTICSKSFSTGSVRDTESTPHQKASTYDTYHVPHPQNNTGANQTCELDHLISLENGGGDGLDNIWPECGPANVSLNQRWFKKKDAVENYVHNGICLNVPDAKFSSGPKPSKALTLDEGQAFLRGNWFACYLKMQAGDVCN